jgi:hypothetical protein
VGKYVEKLLGAGTRKPGSRITMEFLEENGF